MDNIPPRNIKLQKLKPSARCVISPAKMVVTGVPETEIL